MTFLQTFVFAAIQGISELFPISSVGHSVLTPYVFHWNLSPEFLKQNFLPFVVMLHLGTSLALLIYFRQEWLGFVKAITNVKERKSRRLLMMVIVGTIPAGLIGLVLEKFLNRLFSNVTSAAIFLVLNGLLLFFGEKMRRRGTRSITDLTYGQAAIVGLFQSLALIPGFSRSGASMTAGFWVGLKHEESARYSMLLATPIIAAAGVLEIPKLLKSGMHNVLQTSLLGGLLAGIFAYISVTLLMRWFKKKEINAMRPFAYYCWAVGILVLLTILI